MIMEESIIQSNFKTLFLILCKKLLITDENNVFLILDRLARAEAAVISGATEFVQLMGWYGYYRKTVADHYQTEVF